MEAESRQALAVKKQMSVTDVQQYPDIRQYACKFSIDFVPTWSSPGR